MLAPSRSVPLVLPSSRQPTTFLFSAPRVVLPRPDATLKAISNRRRFRANCGQTAAENDSPRADKRRDRENCVCLFAFNFFGPPRRNKVSGMTPGMGDGLTQRWRSLTETLTSLFNSILFWLLLERNSEERSFQDGASRESRARAPLC